MKLLMLATSPSRSSLVPACRGGLLGLLASLPRRQRTSIVPSSTAGPWYDMVSDMVSAICALLLIANYGILPSSPLLGA